VTRERWAVVTGASGGIGQEIVKAIAAEGYSVYTHYHKNEDGLNKLVEELNGQYPYQDFIKVQADLSKTDGADFLVEAIKHPIECLIHNSGKSHVGLVQDVTNNVIDTFVQLQMVSPFRITQQLIPEMVRSKKGKIIFITSVWGVTGFTQW
jgi:3-oxoacyl-[acyl-carrier protein] reductase